MSNHVSPFFSVTVVTNHDLGVRTHSSVQTPAEGPVGVSYWVGGWGLPTENYKHFLFQKEAIIILCKLNKAFCFVAFKC